MFHDSSNNSDSSGPYLVLSRNSLNLAQKRSSYLERWCYVVAVFPASIRMDILLLGLGLLGQEDRGWQH